MRSLVLIPLVLMLAACGSSGGGPAPAASSAAGVTGPNASIVPASPASGPSSGAPASPAAGDGASVIVDKFKFTPAELHVAPGTTVTWTNRELSLHTVTAGTPAAPSTLFDSGTFDTGQTFRFTFTDPGTYPYFCSRHNVMVGMIVVGN